MYNENKNVIVIKLISFIIYNMPYKIVKNRGKNTYKVINAYTGKVKAKSTTLKKAKKQIGLLYLIERRNSEYKKSNKSKKMKQTKKKRT